MSSIIPVESVGRPLYSSDRAVHWAEDVAYALQALNPPTTAQDAVVLFDSGISKTNTTQFAPDVYKIAIGPLIAVIAFDKTKKHAVLQNFMQPGGFGALAVSAVTGTVGTPDLVSNFAYGAYFSGNTSLNITTSGTKDYLNLKWNFTSGTDTYQSSKLIVALT